MVTRKGRPGAEPIPLELQRQDSLEGPENGYMRAALRDVGDHSVTLVEVAHGYDRWRWLKGRLFAFGGWLVAFVAGFALLKDTILGWFSSGGGGP